MKKIYWENMDNLKNYIPYLKPADILLYKPIKNPIESIFGHCIMVNKDLKFIDIYQIDSGLREMPYQYFEIYDKNRQFIIIRMKGISDIDRTRIVDEFYKLFEYSNYNLLVTPKRLTKGTYCSHAVYNSYKRVLKKSVLPKGFLYISPYKFIYSGKYFEQIIIKKGI